PSTGDLRTRRWGELPTAASGRGSANALRSGRASPVAEPTSTGKLTRLRSGLSLHCGSLGRRVSRQVAHVAVTGGDTAVSRQIRTHGLSRAFGATANSDSRNGSGSQRAE